MFFFSWFFADLIGSGVQLSSFFDGGYFSHFMVSMISPVMGDFNEEFPSCQIIGDFQSENGGTKG